MQHLQFIFKMEYINMKKKILPRSLFLPGFHFFGEKLIYSTHPPPGGGEASGQNIYGWKNIIANPLKLWFQNKFPTSQNYYPPPKKKKNHWIYLTPTFSVRRVIFSNNKDLYISYYYFLLLSFFNYYAIKSTLCNTVEKSRKLYVHVYLL